MFDKLADDIMKFFLIGTFVTGILIGVIIGLVVGWSLV